MARIPNRGRKARSITLPAPVGGLNTRDPLAAMDPLYMSTVRNWFPAGTHLEIRKGYESAQTIAGLNSSSAVPGFIKYGETSLWMAAYDQAASEMELKDVVAGTTQTITGHAVDYAPIYTQFANSGGNFVAVIFRNNSATNNYYTYDGSTWTARTAATTNSQGFKYVASFRSRLWFLTDTSGKELSAYYLPTQAITGTTVEFPLGGVASRGGKLYAIGAWTRDAGEGGSDDFIVFSTTAGQAIVYQGTDPASSSTFGLVGVYDMPRPIGAPFKYGADLLMPTEDGLYSMNETLSGNIGPEFAVSHIIRQRWREFVLNNTTTSAAWMLSPGYVTIAYSGILNHLMVWFRYKVAGGVISSQLGPLVMNPQTKAWTEYANFAGNFLGYSVDTLKGDIYFGNMVSTTATAFKFGTAVTDGGATIFTSGQQAYTDLGLPGLQKVVTAVRPRLLVAGNDITISFGMASDLGTTVVTGASMTLAAGSQNPVLHLPITGASFSIGGSAASPSTGASNSTQWFSTDVLYMPGGFV